MTQQPIDIYSENGPYTLEYMRAILDAAIEGKVIQGKAKDSMSDSIPVWFNLTMHELFMWNWTRLFYRAKPDPIAPGHNPDKLTVNQVGEGWRLLSEEENKALIQNGRLIDGLEHWEGSRWYSMACGGYSNIACRTQHPPGYFLPKEPVLIPWTLETVPKGLVLVKYSDACDVYIVTHWHEKGVHVACYGLRHYHDLLKDNWLHSLDSGVTWLPCGTVEGGK